MKQILAICLATALLFATPHPAKAQTYDTTQIQGKLQHLMQSLDKAAIPTGFLEEYGLPAIGMTAFDGVSTNTANWSEPNLWRLLYYQLYTSYARTGANPLPTIQTVNSTISSNLAPGAPTPIAVLLGSYNKFRPDAVQQNLLSYNSAQRRLYDVAGRSGSPYTTHRLYSAVPMRQASLSGAESFVFKPGLVWGNSGLTVNNLQVNFANGQGFVTLAPNTPVAVTWADTGYYQLTIRAALSNGTTAECKAEYFVLQKTSGSSARYLAANITTPAWGAIPATAAHSGGTVQIVYSSKSPTGTLRKPLVVVENMDAFGIAPMLQLQPYDFRSFIRVLDREPQGYDFNQQLDDIAGYDLVFINFNDGMDAVERNAAVVTEALLRINANKVLDNRSGRREQNVVLGMGTGGLNARYGLAQYTKANATTAVPNPLEVRLVLTHDAPHRGQNIALGLQHLSRMMANFRYFGTTSQDVFPEYAQTMAYLQAPVMQQTLLYRATSDDANTPNTFINASYQPMVDYPTAPYRFVATSLGNECARPVHSGKKFMDFGQSVSAGIKVKLGLYGISFLNGLDSLISIPLFKAIEFKYELSVYAGSIPAQYTADRKVAALGTTFNVIIMNFIYIVKTGYSKQANAPAAYLPVDGAPGSINTIVEYKKLRQYQQEIYNSEIGHEELIFKVNIPKTPLVLKFYAFVSYKEWNKTQFTTLYTALPVGSALDVSLFDGGTFTQKFVNGTNPSYPSKAGTYIAQESVTAQNLYNHFSMRFTARNSRYIFNEMEELPNLVNCSGECSNPYVVSGPGLVCTSDVFRISGLPRGATFNWTATPGTAASIAAPNQNPVTIAKASGGSATVSLTVTNGCSSTAITPKVVHFGGYSSSHYPVSGPSSAGCSQYVTFTCPQLAGATNYTWFYPGSPWQYISGQGTNTLTIRTPSSGNQSGQVGVRVANACDAGGSPAVRFISVNCFGIRAPQVFDVAPNPAVSEVSISLKASTAIKANTVAITEINIYDQQGNLRRQQRYASVARAQINISHLPVGVYILEVRSSNGSERHQLSIVK